MCILDSRNGIWNFGWIVYKEGELIMSISIHGIIMFILYVWYIISIVGSLVNLISEDTLSAVEFTRPVSFIQVVISVITILALAGIV